MFCESINWFLYAGNIGSQCVSPEIQVRTGYYLFSSKVKEGGEGCVYLSFLKQIEAIFSKSYEYPDSLTLVIYCLLFKSIDILLSFHQKKLTYFNEQEKI